LDAELTGLVASARGSRIVGGVLRLAEDLGLPVVAEGVEDAEAAQRLAGLGCGLAQGFFFAPGLAPKEAARWALRWAQP
jgi:EAL domain-containing protein (putative c-di-GMP-specific phosphodiesterase class I)